MQNDQAMKADGQKMNPLLLFRDLAGPLQVALAVLSYGAQKYAPCGWQKVEPERYMAALVRHVNALLAGEACDDESGLHHLGHITINALFLLWFEMRGCNPVNWTTFKAPPIDHKPAPASIDHKPAPASIDAKMRAWSEANGWE